MTNKEYKNRLNEHEYYNGHDYLTGYEVSELSKDISRRKKDGHIILNGFNKRASIKKISKTTYILESYYTDVCSYDIKTNEFKKLWYGYSATTLKHINLFCEFFAIKGFNKREWIAL